MLRTALAQGTPRTPGFWLRRASIGQGDLHAAVVSAVIMLPQAIAFAVMAGLPPEMGIYTSVLPVIVAAMAGASHRLLSGPNTMVAIMIGTALLPLAAPGSGDYIALAAALTLFAGGFQLALAALGAGKLLMRLPTFVPKALAAGIGLVMIATQLAPATGQLAIPDTTPWLAAWHALLNWRAMNPCAVIVALATVCAAYLVARARVRMSPLVAAFVAGSALAWLMGLLVGAAVADLDRVGNLRLQWDGPSLPPLRWDEWYILKQLAQSALAIAVVGGLQTIVIARALHRDLGEPFQPRQELCAQGVANIVASLTGSFAGSGSFNRTAAHVKAGARTRAAAVLASLILLGLAWAVGPALGKLATPAVSGVIILIGLGMVRSACAGILKERGFARHAALAGVVAALAAGPAFALGLVTVLGLVAVVLGDG